MLETYERHPPSFTGALVVVTDVRTYSVSNIFAVLVQETRVGTVVGVDGATGGGGATPLYFDDGLRTVFRRTMGSEQLVPGTGIEWPIFAYSARARAEAPCWRTLA